LDAKNRLINTDTLESDIDKWILIATLVGFFAAVSIPAAKATSGKPA